MKLRPWYRPISPRLHHLEWFIKAVQSLWNVLGENGGSFGGVKLSDHMAEMPMIRQGLDGLSVDLLRH